VPYSITQFTVFSTQVRGWHAYAPTMPNMNMGVVNRLRWLIFVYVPMMLFISGFALAGLAGLHVITHPEILTDGLFAMWDALPAYGWFALQRMSEAAYTKITKRAQLAPPPPPALPAVMPFIASQQNEQDASRYGTVFIGLAILGWMLSAPLTAHPAARI
jgi:hypothetical protein